MNLFGCIIKKRAKIEKTEKSAIASDSPPSAKICIMSAKRHVCPQSATASAKRHRKTSAKRHRCPESATASAKRHYKGPQSATNVR